MPATCITKFYKSINILCSWTKVVAYSYRFIISDSPTSNRFYKAWLWFKNTNRNLPTHVFAFSASYM